MQKKHGVRADKSYHINQSIKCHDTK